MSEFPGENQMGVEFQPTDQQQMTNGTGGNQQQQRVQMVTTGDVAARIDGFQNKKSGVPCVAGSNPATVILNRLNVNGGGCVSPVSSSSPSSPQPGQQQSVLSALSSTSHMKRSQVIHE